MFAKIALGAQRPSRYRGGRPFARVDDRGRLFLEFVRRPAERIRFRGTQRAPALQRCHENVEARRILEFGREELHTSGRKVEMGRCASPGHSTAVCLKRVKQLSESGLDVGRKSNRIRIKHESGDLTEGRLSAGGTSQGVLRMENHCVLPLK